MKRKHKKFDNYTGIAKIELEGKEIFVVYADCMMRDCKSQLGSIIGKGETKEEALIDAVKNFTKHVRKTTMKIEKLMESNSKNNPWQQLNKHISDLLCVDLHDIVIPVETDREIRDEENRKIWLEKTGEFVNADLYLIDGKPEIGIF